MPADKLVKLVWQREASRAVGSLLPACMLGFVFPASQETKSRTIDADGLFVRAEHHFTFASTKDHGVGVGVGGRHKHTPLLNGNISESRSCRFVKREPRG